MALTSPDGSHIDRAATQPKRLALLAYLASRPVHRRDTVLGVFWPELDHARGRKALNRAVHYLRSLIGRDSIESLGRETLVLSEDVWVDTRVFKTALGQGRLDEAVGLYNGDLLEGLFLSGVREFEEWLDAERRRLRLLAEEAAQALVEMAEKAGDCHQAVHWAERCVIISPSDETAVYRLVDAKARTGDRVGALRIYEHFCERMRDEFGLEPSATLNRLAEQVALSDGMSVRRE